MISLASETQESGLDFKVVTITPEDAKALLDRNKSNRTIRNGKVNSYATDMVSGDWGLTGEAIKVDRNGDIIDGQHRLLACAQSGKDFQTVLIQGLEPDVKIYMDSGAKRTAADAVYYAHPEIKNRNTVSAMARVAKFYRNDIKTNSTINGTAVTNSEVLEFINSDKNAIVTAAMWGTKIVNTHRSSSAIAAFAYYEIAKKYPEGAWEFFEKVLGMITTGPGDPVHTLIKYLSIAESRNTGEMLNLWFKTWNAYNADNTITTVRKNSTDGSPLLVARVN